MLKEWLRVFIYSMNSKTKGGDQRMEKNLEIKDAAISELSGVSVGCPADVSCGDDCTCGNDGK